MVKCKILFCSSLLLLLSSFSHAQTKISGRVISAGSPVQFANIVLEGERSGTYSDLEGNFNLDITPNSKALLNVTAIGFFRYTSKVDTISGFPNQIIITLRQSDLQLNQVVVTGNMKQSYLTESPVKVEVLTSSFLSKSPTNNIVEAIQTVNGVQEQVNCGVCGTNDIHINGMEGPYTLMLIDGMPIMSSLASVYGFNGIPTALVERIEIIKGPSSTLYGTEAVGGVINIITKSPLDAPKWTLNTFVTSHGEWNLDLGSSIKLNDKVDVTVGVNTYYNQLRFDYNQDNFTDIPLNKRLTIYNKWVFQRKKYDPSTIALRYYKENRFGGVMNWQEEDRGSDLVYGESIKTDRVELIGTYQLPIATEKIRIDYSLTYHKQVSYYGATPYLADQSVLFANFIWDKKIQAHDLLTGLTIRNDQYRDNTFADSQENKWIPGIFIQDEWRFNGQSSWLSGIRFDYHVDHGIIVSPRVNFKQKLGRYTTARINIGTGFRKVNLFTEDHAALTGSRTVIIANELRPERSINLAVNLNHIFILGESTGSIDFDAFYTYFGNKIVPNYEIDPRYIVYDNLHGYGITRGIAFSFSQGFTFPLNYSLGITLQDVYEVQSNDLDGSTNTIPQLFAPKFSGTALVDYTIKRWHLTLDYTSKIMGHQYLPTYSPPYERAEVSPWYSIHNIQATKSFNNGVEIYVAIKNLWNWTQDSPLIAPEDPFGPNFDTAYAWGPLQPRRLLVGIKFTIL